LLYSPPAEQEPCVENTGAIGSGLPALARHEQNERMMALSRKNSLFAGSDEGGENWACLASLVETCKLNGVNPQIYFTDLITRLANGWPQKGIDELMPWHWATQQPP
jgi:hypothetical protein